MAAKVLKYPRFIDFKDWPTSLTDMQRDERREEGLSFNESSWSNQSTYLLNPHASVSYSESPNFLGSYEPHFISEPHGYPTGSVHDASGLASSAPLGSTWSDIPLDPNAIYHMPLHSPGWPNFPDPESPYERDRLALRRAWEQTVRDQWLRRNGINASPTDSQYDQYIPELRAGEYAERYFGGTDAQSEPLGKRTEAVLSRYSENMSESITTNAGLPGNYQMPTASPYYTLGPENRIHREPSSSSIGRSFANDHPSVPSSSTLQLPNIRSLQLSYRENSAGCSPTDTGSPTSLHPNVPSSQVSASPATILSPLDSETADSPLSEIYKARSTSPSGSILVFDPPPSATSASASSNLDSTGDNFVVTRSRSVDNTPHGHAGMGPVRRGNSASDRGKNAAGTIRVHRPAGIKWNQRTRCAYINPVTGLQCRTSAGRGPDLERHLRTVHLREEARAVSDGLIPRDKAELLPPDWVMGDRLDFDCPHCAVRFTREDARDRHVKVQHNK
ncbi:hypothetical protein BDV93DRAFT_521409 [Ceratobasidium sp. AG-I]|nr:hypothetical protein BDV93DRAFT_521409 [Ceratobasidium sp. AG-I]